MSNYDEYSKNIDAIFLSGYIGVERVFTIEHGLLGYPNQ